MALQNPEGGRDVHSVGDHELGTRLAQRSPSEGAAAPPWVQGAEWPPAGWPFHPPPPIAHLRSEPSQPHSQPCLFPAGPRVAPLHARAPGGRLPSSRHHTPWPTTQILTSDLGCSRRPLSPLAWVGILDSASRVPGEGKVSGLSSGSRCVRDLLAALILPQTAPRSHSHQGLGRCLAAHPAGSSASHVMLISPLLSSSELDFCLQAKILGPAAGTGVRNRGPAQARPCGRLGAPQNRPGET